ncbi:MAG: MXAN_5187 C-terminal domain-containing protein [Myxococcota bacterium]
MQTLADVKRKIASVDEVAKECDAIEAELASLRAAYEQYFLGLDRQPPSRKHAELKKRVRALQTSFVRQTSAKFRTQSLLSTFLTYERLWNRTLQEIEAGTYRRDLFKAKLHSQKRPEPAKKAEEAKPAPAVPAPPSGLSDEKLRAVFNAYVTAKKRCNEDVSSLTYDTMAATLRKQVPALLKQHNAQGVDFKVVIKDGKAVLRALPK